jgi:hypothetical protein
MDSSKAAAPAEKSLFSNSDIRAKIKKFAEQKLIEDETPRLQVTNNSEGIRSSVARLSSRSIDGLERLNSELQELQKFLRLEVERVQSKIDRAAAGIQVITEVLAPWKSNTSASQSSSTNARDVHADPLTSLNGETAQSSG